MLILQDVALVIETKWDPTNRGGKSGIGWLERYDFVVSTLALGLKINFDQMDGISRAGGDKMAAS